ncbi:MAG TPA: class I SAM-dependent methyltransferase [Pirellulales bacterium]|nr:class I SAM-dependent methyltransferase [Pirellulales bacterium]
MHLWQKIVDEQKLGAHSEPNIHPHAPEEYAQLFHCAGDATTELEYLNLIHALVFATKPECLLETGSWRGMGTLAIASAIAANGFGKLYSIDLKPADELRTNLKKYGLSEQVEVVANHSITFCVNWTGAPFDFAFFDSDVHCRAREHDILRRRGKLAPGAVCVFHDTSAIRHGVDTSFDFIRYTEAAPGLTFPLSRGLKVVQDPPFQFPYP